MNTLTRLTVAAGVSLAVSCGCVQTVETSDGRPMPAEPTAAPATPVAAPINAIAVVFGAKAIDTNGNMRPDLIQMQVYLFSRPYPSPTWREGEIEVLMYKPGQAGDPRAPGPNPLRTWRLSAPALETVKAKALVGDCYAIALSLLDDGGTDLLPVYAVDVIVRFFPADGGEPTSISEVRTLPMSSPVVAPGRAPR